MTAQEHHVAIAILHQQGTQLLSDVLAVCDHIGCALRSSRMEILGEQEGMLLLLAGNWGAIARLEVALADLEKKWGIEIQIHRTQPIAASEEAWMSYTVQLVAIDRIGLLGDITRFLWEYEVQIEELSVQTYLTPRATRMVNINLKTNIPDKIQLPFFKEQLMAFCDERNVDVYLDPVRLQA